MYADFEVITNENSGETNQLFIASFDSMIYNSVQQYIAKYNTNERRLRIKSIILFS